MQPTRARRRVVVLTVGIFLLIICIGLFESLNAATPRGHPAPPAPFTSFYWDTFIKCSVLTLVIAGLASYGVWRWQQAQAR